MDRDDAPLSRIMDELEKSGHGDKVSVRDVTNTFRHRSLGALLTVFSLIAALPVVGGIPGISILTGTLILIAVGQSLVGQGSLWLPRAIERRQIGRGTMTRAITKARPWIAWIDRFIRPRLTLLSRGKANRWIIAAVAALLALTFYPLAFVPWGVTAPALGVLALGLGLMGCDGVFILVGYLFVGATGYALYALV